MAGEKCLDAPRVERIGVGLQGGAALVGQAALVVRMFGGLGTEQERDRVALNGGVEEGVVVFVGDPGVAVGARVGVGELAESDGEASVCGFDAGRRVVIGVEGAGEHELDGGFDVGVVVDVAEGGFAFLGDEEDEGALVVGAAHAPDEAESYEGPHHHADHGLDDAEAVAELALQYERAGREDGANHVEPSGRQLAVGGDVATELERAEVTLLMEKVVGCMPAVLHAPCQSRRGGCRNRAVVETP